MLPRTGESDAIFIYLALFFALVMFGALTVATLSALAAQAMTHIAEWYGRRRQRITEG